MDLNWGEVFVGFLIAATLAGAAAFVNLSVFAIKRTDNDVREIRRQNARDIIKIWGEISKIRASKEIGYGGLDEKLDDDIDPSDDIDLSL